MPVIPGQKMRARALPQLTFTLTRTAATYTATSTQWFPSTKGFASIMGTQVTESEGHPWRGRKRGFNGDIGGDFYTRKQYVDGNIPSYYLYQKVPNPSAPTMGTIYKVEFPGISIPKSLGLGRRLLPAELWPPLSDTSEDDLAEYGATAIANCKPTNSVADLTTALGELFRDGLPSLIGATTWKDRTARSLADEHLNYQFGIKPLVNDVKKFINGVKNMDRILVQFERDAGKIVRRKYYFPHERDVKETVVSTSDVQPWLGDLSSSALFDTSSAVCVRRRETLTRRWFSGAFTYTLPSGMTSRSNIGEMALRADRYGLTLTPDTIWNLAPWSWAADWFSNAGDVISNISDTARYGLVLRYGYIMEHKRVSDTYSITGLRDLNGKPVILPSTTLVTETKRRMRANPFGFGVRWDSLSGLQLSILAALGLSRGSHR